MQALTHRATSTIALVSGLAPLRCDMRPRKLIVDKICAFCGKPFQVYPCESRHQCCSHECASLLRKGVPNIPNSKPKVEKICQHCEKKYLVHPCRAASSRYCSFKCTGSANVSRGLKQYNYLRRKRTPYPCPTCGNIRLLRDSEIKSGRFFCGIRCYRLHRPTSIERIIQDELRQIGIEFVPEHRIGRWCIDIFIPSFNVAIECDGAYWHKRTHDIDRDRRKDIFLGKLGIQVIRLPEEDIRSHLNQCVQRILSSLIAMHD